MINIDISNVAIKQMQRKCKKRAGIIFKQMDVLDLKFEDSKFNVVLDKGTLDALMPDFSEKTKSTVDKMFKVSFIETFSSKVLHVYKYTVVGR